jgi:hypothetical protein
MEGVTTDGPSTVTTMATLDLQPETIRCLWQGCFTEFKDGTHDEVWNDHIRLAHLEQQDQHGRPLPGAPECQWDGCGKRFRQSQGAVKHMAIHVQDIPRQCPLGCGKKFRAGKLTKTRHLKHCPLRGTTAARGQVSSVE